MDQDDLFNNLPSETVLDILSRLPVSSIMRCKCVCKRWRNFLETCEFVNCHLSKSALVPCSLTFFEKEKGARPRPYKIKEYDLEHRWNTVFNFDLPTRRVPSSARGLLLCKRERGGLIVCNPVTREYINLPPPPRTSLCGFHDHTLGFGVSKTSFQYKVVRVFNLCDDESEVHVYTVGTGSWRITGSRRLGLFESRIGSCLNGNLHWLVGERGSSISCLDLETETFTTFSTPPNYPYKSRMLCVLKGCLGVCDNNCYKAYPTAEVNADYEIDIWLMKEYGDEKSWTKEFVIRKDDRFRFLGELLPVKVLEDGDILMKMRKTQLLYSGKSRSIGEADMFGVERQITLVTGAADYSPTFLPLKSFAPLENVLSF